jgi:N4-gp56 family major capsid protein
MAFENPHAYNDPAGGTDSTVGAQIYTEFFQKKALVEAAKEQYFGQLADVTAMPKHYGKKIKLFHYLPILDDRNINDQGIDAEGVSTYAGFVANKNYLKHVIKVTAPAADGGMDYYFEGVATGSTSSAAATAAEGLAQGKVRGWAATLGITGADYGAVKTALGVASYTVEDNEVGSATDAGAAYGNLYGSSKDIGTITGKLPALTEHGGRVNRVGMTRLTIEGTIEKFGFFEEYTQDSLDFDNDSELEMHITTEAVKAANEMTEDQLQIDLLNGAGVVRYTGDATSTATLGGGTQAALAAGTVDTLSYDDLVKLGIELDNNRTPKNTRLVTGSRMIDTKVVNAARYAYIGSELLPTLMQMKDYHGNPAWIPVAQYGAATQIARGEHGAIGDWRFIVVPEMMHWDAAGADVGTETDEVCYWSSNAGGQAKVNVYPVLVVGDGSFTTIGFQTDGKTVKFRITHKKPGKEIADRNDPYGETGFYSIKWWYGTMILRPERLALIKTVAVM